MNTSSDTLAAWRPSSFGFGPDDDGGAEPPATGARGPSPWAVPELGAAPERDGASDGAAAPRIDPEEAFARGYAEGTAAGEARGREELMTAAESLRGAAQALVSSRGRILHDLEANVGALAMAAARRIVQKEVEADPSLVRSLVARGLELVKPDSTVEVKLHPADLESAREGIRALADDQSLDLSLTPDPGIARGGFVLQTPSRMVDGRLEEGLRTLYERLAYE